MIDFIVWVFTNFAMAPYNLAIALMSPGSWLDWSNNESLVRFIYYGASVEFFFVVFTGFLVITLIGAIWKRQMLWVMVRAFEAIANGVGRTVAWVGLIMVLQQVMIVFLQRIFQVPGLELGPLGISFTQDLSWFAEELKLYNAMIVCLCVSYTFVQGGHVRVDLFYSGMRHRAKRIIDMGGALFFMLPTTVLTYLYAWFFMWRHLVVPNPAASSELDRMIMQARVLRWNVETIGFSPNGFNAYFIFKVLLVAFCVMVFIHALAVFWRAFLEYVEGEESADKYRDLDPQDAETEALHAAGH